MTAMNDGRQTEDLKTLLADAAGTLSGVARSADKIGMPDAAAWIYEQAVKCAVAAGVTLPALDVRGYGSPPDGFEWVQCGGEAPPVLASKTVMVRGRPRATAEFDPPAQGDNPL